MSNNLNYRTFIFLTFLLGQAMPTIADDKPALKIADEFVALLSDIQKELKAEKSIKNQAACENNIRLHVKKLKTFKEQCGFAYIAYQFSRLYGDLEDDQFCSGYRCAFTQCLFLMAKDKSKDAQNSFHHMKEHLKLDFYDGGLAHDFESAMRTQAASDTPSAIRSD